jgi:hypothetical protein
MTEPCLACGKPVEMPDGIRPRALCDRTCMHIWAIMNDREIISIDDYQGRTGA